MKEKRLIKKIKNGNQEALNTFIKEYYPQVYTFAYQKLQGDDTAKDITQEVFIRFIKNIPMYQSEGKTIHYLYRMTSNLCYDHFRKIKHEQTIYIEDTNHIAGNLDIHETLIKQLRYEELMFYIHLLKENQQDIILLKYFHQMTFKEIAESFSIPISTIKTRHTVALRKLQDLWKENTYEKTHSNRSTCIRTYD